MAKKRLLYIEDLYDFYSNKYKRSTKFSTEKTGEPLVVQVHGRVNFDESDKNKDGLLPVHLQSCHTDLNVNGSNIDSSVMEAALPSFSNRPILGYIHKVTTDENPEGQWEFYSHNMHEDENGNVVYDEYPIGIIPESCNAQLVYDEEKKKTYCEVDGYIFEEYSKAAEILQREEECSVSVELSIRELSYDAKQKFLNIEDFWFSGVTILGKTPQGNEVKPGMTGSNIKLADFSSKNNSLFEDYKSKMVELQARIENLETACFNKEQSSSVRTLSKEGGNKESMTKFEELLAKYNKTVEDVTFDYSELSDEELEAKFAEVFGEDNNTDGDNSGDNTANEPSNDNEGDGENSTEPEGTTDGDNEGEGQNFENMTKTFEISHDDIRYALYNLLSSYEDADNEWYYITGVYDSYFVYESWDGGKIYGQKYTKNNDNVAFDGERYTLHKEYLTDSEYTEIQNMRADYSSIVSELNTYKEKELDEKKNTLFDSDDYKGIRDTEDFAELKKKAKDYSLEELSEHLDKIISKSVKNGTFSFSVKESEKKTTHINFAQNLIEETPKKNSFLDGLLNC